MAPQALELARRAVTALEAMAAATASNWTDGLGGVVGLAQCGLIASPVRSRREEFNNPGIDFRRLFQVQEMSKPWIDFFFQALGEQMIHGVECRKTAWPVSCAM